MTSPTSMATVRSNTTVSTNVMSNTVTSLFGWWSKAAKVRH